MTKHLFIYLISTTFKINNSHEMKKVIKNEVIFSNRPKSIGRTSVIYAVKPNYNIPKPKLKNLLIYCTRELNLVSVHLKLSKNLSYINTFYNNKKIFKYIEEEEEELKRVIIFCWS